jgi:disulfide bond formation protein DsbB
MDVAVADRFFALMTLAALVASLAVLGLAVAARWWPAASDLSQRFWSALGGAPLWLAWLVAVASLLGSLYYSEIAGYPPCSLCWYQRIAMYPLAVVLGIAAWRGDRGIRRYAMPLVVVGGLIAVYQYVLGYLPEGEVLGCSIDVSCTERFVWEFGFVDFPFMSFVAFLAIASLLASPPAGDEETR